MQQVRDWAVSTRLPRAKPASPAQARSVSHDYATYELRVQKSPSNEVVRAGAGVGPRERYRKEGAHGLLQSKVPKEVRDRPSVWVRRRRAAVRLQG